MKHKTALWISYDLGIQGDYPSLFSWLDKHDAQDCGDSMAFLQYEHHGDLQEHLTTELRKAVVVDTRTRIYAMFRDAATDKNKGVFIFGGRMAPRWTGYASKGTGVVDGEED